jgi:AraC family transcriptional regulator
VSSGPLSFVDPGRFELVCHSSPFTEETRGSVQIYVPLERAVYSVVCQADGGRKTAHRLGSRDILIVPAGKPHTIESRRNASIVSLRLLESFGDVRDAFTVRDAFVTAMAKQLRTAMESEREMAPAYADALATAIACRVTSPAVVGRRIRAEPRVTALSSRQLATLERHVDGQLGRAIQLSELAALFGISPWHFMRRFHVSHGMSPHQYVIDRRLARAQALLRETDKTITETATAIGMTHSHFSRTFRRRFGVSPREFRERETR